MNPTGASAAAGRVAAAPGWRWRAAATAMCLIVAICTAPLVTIATWADGTLIDTDSFTESLVPLAQDPGVQGFIAAQVQDAVEAEITSLASGDVSGALAGALLDSVLGDRLRALVTNATDSVLQADSFPVVFDALVRQSHARLIRALATGEDLDIDLGVIAEHVRARLIAQGRGALALLPEVDVVVPVLEPESLATARQAYLLTTAAGAWLPWVLVAASIGAVVTAGDRRRAVMILGVGVFLTMAAFAILVWWATATLVGATSPVPLPAASAEAILAPFARPLRDAAVTFAAGGLLVAAGAGWAGRRR